MEGSITIDLIEQKSERFELIEQIVIYILLQLCESIEMFSIDERHKKHSNFIENYSNNKMCELCFV